VFPAPTAPGASVSKETISQITDKVLEKMTDWCSRPLDGVYAAILVDAVMVKGQGRAGGQPARLRRHRRHLGRGAGHPGAQV
jgi:putative transposase